MPKAVFSPQFGKVRLDINVDPTADTAYTQGMTTCNYVAVRNTKTGRMTFVHADDLTDVKASVAEDIAWVNEGASAADKGAIEIIYGADSPGDSYYKDNLSNALTEAGLKPADSLIEHRHYESAGVSLNPALLDKDPMDLGAKALSDLGYGTISFDETNRDADRTYTLGQMLLVGREPLLLSPPNFYDVGKVMEVGDVLDHFAPHIDVEDAKEKLEGAAEEVPEVGDFLTKLDDRGIAQPAAQASGAAAEVDDDLDLDFDPDLSRRAVELVARHGRKKADASLVRDDDSPQRSSSTKTLASRPALPLGAAADDNEISLGDGDMDFGLDGGQDELMDRVNRLLEAQGRERGGHSALVAAGSALKGAGVEEAKRRSGPSSDAPEGRFAGAVLREREAKDSGSQGRDGR